MDWCVYCAYAYTFHVCKTKIQQNEPKKWEVCARAYRTTKNGNRVRESESQREKWQRRKIPIRCWNFDACCVLVGCVPGDLVEAPFINVTCILLGRCCPYTAQSFLFQFFFFFWFVCSCLFFRCSLFDSEMYIYWMHRRRRVLYNIYVDIITSIPRDERAQWVFNISFGVWLYALDFVDGSWFVWWQKCTRLKLNQTVQHNTANIQSLFVRLLCSQTNIHTHTPSCAWKWTFVTCKNSIRSILFIY